MLDQQVTEKIKAILDENGDDKTAAEALNKLQKTTTYPIANIIERCLNERQRYNLVIALRGDVLPVFASHGLGFGMK